MKKLFSLVDGLSKNEKRYFKTHTKSNNALEIFDLINKEKRDIARIEKYSSKEKNYLLNSILRSLRGFHGQMSVNRMLDNYVHEIDILVNKELYDLALSRVHQGEKLAARHEKVHHQILFLRFRRRIERNRGLDNEESIKTHYKNLYSLFKLMNVDYHLAEMINNYREKAFLEREYDLENEVEKLLLTLSPDLREKIKTNYLYTRINGFMSFDKKQSDEAYEYYSNMCKIFQEKSPRLPDSALDYFSRINYVTVLHSFLTVLKETDREKEFFEVIEILKNSEGMSVKEASKSFVNMSVSLTDYFLRKNEIKKGITFLLEYKQKIESISYERDRMELLYFNMAYIYFLQKHFRDAHRYISKYILYQNPKYKILYKASNFVYILIQLELNKLDFAFSVLDKFVKKLKNEGQYNTFDDLLAQFITSHFSPGSLSQQAEKHYSDLSDLIKNGKTGLIQVNLNQYFNFKGWMESKLFNKPFNP